MQASRNGDEWQEWRRMETNESSHNIISEASILMIQLRTSSRHVGTYVRGPHLAMSDLERNRTYGPAETPEEDDLR